MNKLKTSTAIILTLTALCLGSQLIAGQLDQEPAPVPVPVVAVPIPEPEQIHVEGIFLRDIDDVAIADLAQNLHDVKDIAIIGNFGDVGLINLSPNLPNNLNSLQLNVNHFGIQGLTALAQNLPRLIALTQLQLSVDNIDDDGAAILAPNLPLSLNIFGITHNNIGDAGLEALSDRIAQMDNLKILILNNNQISDHGASYLADHLPNSLEHLYLARTNIGRDGLVALGGKLFLLPNIRLVNLINAQFNDEDKAAFNATIQGKLVETMAGVWSRPQAD